ncbi:phosphate acyltransferase PlsX [Tindallia californiensis]|uniref:Phosphate acyltransferase n=1 Tax=Tindallia californiensis TaxID=159292 RepID=A0A1H3NTF9_9FIRM|nr:phosphate acyltransferase PlsX [Tindallia californiensis]SDY92207.1 phosphate:acyl-[acyl carrier protein] acyltransferase [Tindallia californiensis]
MKIVLDAMGGDIGPSVNVAGAVEAVEEWDVEVILTGNQKQIEDELQKFSYDKERITIVNCTEVIENSDKPSTAIRKKKDSSLVVGFEMIKEKKADAIISAGNTGALLAGGLFIIGRIKGLKRPALAVPFPTPKGLSLLVDAGANVDCKAQHLYEFALMGSLYMEFVGQLAKPKVCLVNVGAEKEKGNELTKEVYQILSSSDLHFEGNIEARDIPSGYADVVVCDGFTGNIILKLFEGVAQTFSDGLKNAVLSDWKSKLGGFLMQPAFKSFKKQFDYTEHGGVPFLGVNGLVIKAHGSSNSKAIKNAIKQARITHEALLIDKIKDRISEMTDTGNSIEGENR